jgi:hypothetical protein
MADQAIITPAVAEAMSGAMTQAFVPDVNLCAFFLQRKQSLHAATATTSVNAPTIAKKQISLSTNYYARVSKTLLLPLLQIMFAPSSFRKSSHDRTLHGCGSRINQLTDWRTLLSLASIYTP